MGEQSENLAHMEDRYTVSLEDRVHDEDKGQRRQSKGRDLTDLLLAGNMLRTF